MIFRSIGLFGRYQDVAVKATLNEIREHLEQRGRSVFLGDTTHQEIAGLRVSARQGGMRMHAQQHSSRPSALRSVQYMF